MGLVFSSAQCWIKTSLISLPWLYLRSTSTGPTGRPSPLTELTKPLAPTRPRWSAPCTDPWTYTYIIPPDNLRVRRYTCCKWKCSSSVWCGVWDFSSLMLLWLQCQITRVRWIMVAAVTCVCSPPEEATSVPVPPTSIWLLMENSACPTVQPARCVCVSLAQISKYFPEM